MENTVLIDILRSKGMLSEADVKRLHNMDSSYLMPEEEPNKFNEHNSREIVSKMYHMENGKKFVGEKYKLSEAKEMLERYKGVLPTTISCYDMYVAINEHYHNYSSLYKAWFGSSIDMKIVESAIVYWFRDEDWNDGCKIWKHFNKD